MADGYTSLRDMFDGGGAGRSGPRFEGGGVLSAAANAVARPAGSRERGDPDMRTGLGGFARDMFDGGGFGRTGPTFQGGPYSGLLNAIGARPMGYMGRLGSVRPQMRPQAPAAYRAPAPAPAPVLATQPNYADRFAAPVLATQPNYADRFAAPFQPQPPAPGPLPVDVSEPSALAPVMQPVPAGAQTYEAFVDSFPPEDIADYGEEVLRAAYDIYLADLLRANGSQ